MLQLRAQKMWKGNNSASQPGFRNTAHKIQGHGYCHNIIMASSATDRNNNSVMTEMDERDFKGNNASHVHELSDCKSRQHKNTIPVFSSTQKIEPTMCYETSANKHNTLGNSPKTRIHHPDHGESLKSLLSLLSDRLFALHNSRTHKSDTVCNLLRTSKRITGNPCSWSECAIHSLIHSFISNLSDDRSTASSKTIPPLNAI
jgi:hypothetical protein